MVTASAPTDEESEEETMTLSILRITLGVVAVVIVTAILWIDLSTDIWQKYAVISGLAGGLVTFVLTVLVVDRVIARATHERWAPVTRVALGELRHALLQEDADIDEPAVRRLPVPQDDRASLDEIIVAAAAERRALTEVLARWSSFLASSADVAEIMDTVAEIAERLDEIDAATRMLRHERAVAAVDRSGVALAPTALRGVLREIDAYHRSGDMLIGHIDAALAEDRRARAAR